MKGILASICLFCIGLIALTGASRVSSFAERPDVLLKASGSDQQLAWQVRGILEYGGWFCIGASVLMLGVAVAMQLALSSNSRTYQVRGGRVNSHPRHHRHGA